MCPIPFRYGVARKLEQYCVSFYMLIQQSLSKELNSEKISDSLKRKIEESVLMNKIKMQKNKKSDMKSFYGPGKPFRTLDARDFLCTVSSFV